MSNLYDGHKPEPLKAILLVCMGYFLFSYGDMLIKITSKYYHVSEIMFFGGFFSMLACGGYGLARYGVAGFRTTQLKLHLIRASISVVISGFTIYGISHVTMAQFYTLVFTSPFWLALLSALFLKDKITRDRGIAIAIGFLTVMMMFSPGGMEFNIGAMAVLAGAFLYANMLMVIRKMGPNESKLVLVVIGAIVSMCVSMIFLPQHFIMPPPKHMFLFFLQGTSGGIGLVLISMGLHKAPSPTLVAPFHYTQIVYGILFGWFIFNEVPSHVTLAGAAIIVLTGIYLIRSEARRKAQNQALAAEWTEG